MTSVPPPEYVLARFVLLDALQALGPHLDAVVLVGAQAVYFHTGNVELIVVPTTTDADLALFPAIRWDIAQGASSMRPRVETDGSAAPRVQDAGRNSARSRVTCSPPSNWTTTLAWPPTASR